MKTKLYQNALLCCALALTAACSNDTEEALAEQQNAPQEVTLIASIGGNDTRTYVYKDGDAYKTYWSYGDDILAWGYKSEDTDMQKPYAYGTLALNDNKVGGTSGAFKGFIWGGGTASDLNYALYPAPDTKSDDYKSFGYTLKSEYDYTKVYNASSLTSGYDFIENSSYKYVDSKAPMYCIIPAESDPATESSNLVFSHLCGMLRLRLLKSNLDAFDIDPNGSNTITVTVTADTDITGKAKVTLGGTAFTVAIANEANSSNKEVVFKNIPASLLGLKEASSTSGSSLLTGGITLDTEKPLDLDVPIPTNEEIEYTVTMTYPKQGENELATATIYVGRHEIGAGDIWIPNIAPTNAYIGTNTLGNNAN